MAQVSTCFRVIGANVNPDEITQLLGISPTQAHRKGDPRVGRSGREYSPFSEGVWILESGIGEEKTVDEQIEQLISELQPIKHEISKFATGQYQLDLFIGIFGIEGNTELVISSKTLKTLSELGIDLRFDLYS